MTRAKSSERFVNLLTLTPSAGSISYNVITGPFFISTISPCTPKENKASINSSPLALKTSSEISVLICSGSSNKSAVGSL